MKLSRKKTNTTRAHDCLNVSSFLSQRAFNRKPKTRNPVAARKRAIVADISFKIKDIIIGNIMNIPEICMTNPRLDKIALIFILSAEPDSHFYKFLY
jgi:hypothetical protein